MLLGPIQEALQFRGRFTPEIEVWIVTPSQLHRRFAPPDLRANPFLALFRGRPAPGLKAIINPGASARQAKTDGTLELFLAQCAPGGDDEKRGGGSSPLRAPFAKGGSNHRYPIHFVGESGAVYRLYEKWQNIDVS